MEQTNNNFPKFEKGQVLTSQALNNYFGYLDEQQRLTRTKLLGIGIINGLEYELYGNKLIINKGTAVTADGYLIDLPEDTTYTLAYEYNPKSNMLAKCNPLTEKDDDDFKNVLNHVKYVLYKDESDAVLHKQSPKNKKKFPDYREEEGKYLLALMVDFVSQDNISKCSELSCDIIQTNYVTEIRPVFIEKELLKGKELSFLSKQYSYWKFNYIAVSYQGIFHKNKKEIYDLSGNNYNDFLQGLINELIEEDNTLDKNITRILEDINKNSLFSNKYDTRLENLKAHISKFKDLKGNIPGYYLHHIENILSAIVEFVRCYNDFAKKYPAIPINGLSFKRIALLGFEKYDLKNNVYRQYNNLILQDFQFIEDRSTIEKAFNRIFLLAENFDFDFKSSNSGVDFSFKNPHAKLGEQIKPGFYNSKLTGNDWQFDTEQSLYYDHSFAANDFLIVNDYYGTKKINFDTALYNYKLIYHLPLTAEYIPVGDLNSIINKYKKDYSKEVLLDILLNLNNLNNTYSSVGNENPYCLEPTWREVFYTIDSHKEFSTNDAREYLDKLDNYLKEFKTLKNSGLFSLFSEFYKNREMSNGYYYHDKNWTHRDYFLNNEKKAALFNEKCSEQELTKLKYFNDSLWYCINRSTSTASNSGKDDIVLRYCLEYLSYFAKCEFDYIDGCPYDGKLTVFYTSDNEEKVLLVVGSNKTD